MNVIVSVVLFLLIQVSNCARILAVFPAPSISHQVVFRPLTQELARRGHDVTVITPDPIYPQGKSPENFTEIDVHDISYGLWRNKYLPQFEMGNMDSLYVQGKLMVKALPEIVAVQAKLKEVQDVIRNKKFDLIILELCTRSALMYSHIVKAPVIQISSFGMMIGSNHGIGAPSHPILYPNGLRHRLYNLTFWDKISELYKHWWIESLFDANEEEENKMLRDDFGNDAPTLQELRNNIDLVMLNTHPLWSDNQPWPPNVVSIWGLYKQPHKDLPQDLQSYLDASKHGVIYFSLGSNALSSAMSQDKIQTIINVFSKLPYDVLWKYEKDQLPGKSDNIKIEKWLPQPALLKHPNIKLFITQGGLQSTDEAINAGVPLIGIPMLGDQWYNVEKYVYYKIGLRLDLPDLTEDKLRTAIETVIHDPSFKNNIAKLRSLMNDQPESALSRAVWWTEYVLRHGGAKHLRAAGANVPLAQYYEIEFILTLVGTVLLVTIVTLAILRKLYQKIGLSVKIKTD